MPRPTTLHCPHFGTCGGCTALDIDIADQLAAKQARARELLAPFLGDGAITPEIAPPPRPPRHDRTSILYPVQSRRGELRLGIYRTGTHEVEPITDCRIQHKALTALAVRAGDVLRKLRLPAYDETAHRGLVRAFRARIMPGSNELLLGVVVTRRDFREREALAEALWRAAQDLRDEQGRELAPVGVVINVNEARGNALLGPVSFAPRGRTWQQDEVRSPAEGGKPLRLRVSFGSFYQQNRYADAILFRPALALLGDVTGTRIVDGYGGVAAFGARLLAAGAAHVTLIASNAVACDDARHNLAAALTGGRAAVREEVFGSTPLPACDLLIADPPRAGLGEAGAAAVLAASPPRVLLVSCALAALARDLAALTPTYRVRALRLCDLFPHTDHVEALTLLERA
ncbi:MAG: class I SAM-dependent RNA methyltransferase [Planctomycetes bacterium]|nr:class I SAM-dependent RNA methyltransferase [Planctomycetota bacterium]